MHNLPSLLYYRTPLDQFPTYYGPDSLKAPFEMGKRIFTQLPKNIAIIRSIAVLAYSALAASSLQSSLARWSVAVIGLSFAGWTIYSHLVRKDPLVEAFYKIVGGEARFEKLPEIQLVQAPNEKICEAIRKIKWEVLKRPIYKAKTLDGRHIIIVKGLSRTTDFPGLNCQTKAVWAFMEKVGPKDMPRRISNLSELGEAILEGILPPWTGNTFGRCLEVMSGTRHNVAHSSRTEVCSSLSTEMANELHVQLQLISKE